MVCALVLGMGLSGQAAAELLLATGYEVFGFDDKSSFQSLESLIDKGLKWLPESQQIPWTALSLCVVSPGISPKHPVYRQAVLQKLNVIGEAELAFSHLKQKAVGITGTNGKTTVTLLIEHVLNESGIAAKALGNVGLPLSSYVLQSNPEEIVVAELSSYQLETMKTPVLDAAVILNITPDHLDRYPSMQEYAEAKCRLQNLLKIRSPFFVSSQVIHEFGQLLKPGYRNYLQAAEIERICFNKYRELQGHEKENALAAWAVCQHFGVNEEQFLDAMASFKKPHHRIEFVATIDGIHFFDDSKGTNLDAVIRAVDSMKGPVILIAGGVDKGASYLPWKQAFGSKVKRIFALGQAAPKIYEELSPFFNMEIVDSLGAAVERSMLHAVQGDNILLSPGCSSFDMFRDYAHRGDEFKKVIEGIAKLNFATRIR